MFGLFGVPLDVPLLGFPVLGVVPGFFVGVVTGGFFFGVVDVGLVAGLLVGRDVLPPIIPPPVTPPSCCAHATFAQVSKNRTVNTNRNRGTSGVLDDIGFSPVFEMLAFGLKQVGNSGRIIMLELPDV